MRFFVPPRNELRPLGEWGKGTENIPDYNLALPPPPQFRFSKDTVEEFIIVFQTKLLENRLFKSLNVWARVYGKPKFIRVHHFIVSCEKYFFSVTFSGSL